MAYTGHITQRFGLCFDTETSGRNAIGSDKSDGFQIVSLGALIVDLQTYEPVDGLYVEVKWNGSAEWSQEAEDIHGLTKAYLDEHGVTEEEASYQLLSLIAKWNGLGQYPGLIPICHRPAFDIAFVNRMLSSIDCSINWSSTWIDTAALGACLIGREGSDSLFEYFGFDARGKHNSLEDAYMTLAVARAFRDIFNSKLTNDAQNLII